MTKSQFRHSALDTAAWCAEHAAVMHRAYRNTATIPLMGVIALALICAQCSAATSLLLSLGCVPLYFVAWIYIGEAERCRCYWMLERQRVLEKLWEVEGL